MRQGVRNALLLRKALGRRRMWGAALTRGRHVLPARGCPCQATLTIPRICRITEGFESPWGHHWSGTAHGGDVGRGGDGFLPARLRSAASDTLYSGAPSTWPVSRNIKRKSDESGPAPTSPQRPERAHNPFFEGPTVGASEDRVLELRWPSINRRPIL